MEGPPFDDPIFADFPGQSLPSLNSTLLQHKSPGSSSGNDRGVHSIQVMLGLHQQHHSQQDDAYGGAHIDLGPLFPSTTEKTKPPTNDNQQQQQQQAPPASPAKPKIDGKTKAKNDGNNGVKKKKTRWVLIILIIYTSRVRFYAPPF